MPEPQTAGEGLGRSKKLTASLQICSFKSHLERWRNDSDFIKCVLPKREVQSLDSCNPHKEADTATHTRNPGDGKAKKGRFLELTGQLV